MVDMLTLSLLLEKSPVPPPPPAAMDLRIVDARFSLEDWKTWGAGKTGKPLVWDDIQKRRAGGKVKFGGGLILQRWLHTR